MSRQNLEFQNVPTLTWKHVILAGNNAKNLENNLDNRLSTFDRLSFDDYIINDGYVIIKQPIILFSFLAQEKLQRNANI